MAEKKPKNYIAADEKTKEAAKQVQANYTQAKPVGNAGANRAIAVVLWVLALVMEVLAFMVLLGKVDLKFCDPLYQLIGFLVIDLILVIVGAQFWKKANHIDPVSEANKVKFWLWNNMGVIACAICFIPFVILTLLNKDADKKTKTIAVVVALVACLIGGAASIDYNPVSEEQLDAAVTELGDETVYWARFGKVYHTHDDCSSLNQSYDLYYGTVAEAIAANRTRLCSFCAKRDNITTLTTDE